MKELFATTHAQRKGKAVVALILLSIIVMGIMSTPQVRLITTPKRLLPIYQVPTDEKVVALTFDISWGTKTPEPVLKILKEKKVTSTFFLSGPWVKNWPEIARLVKEGGHEIGSHGHRHINLSTISAPEIAQEIELAHRSLKEVLGVEARLIRAPNGDYDNEVVSTARSLGYEIIQWSVDSLDWMNPGVDAIINRVLDLAHPGAIILMHASDSCKQTTTALPAVIEGLRAKGFRLVTVSELIAIGQPKPKLPPLEKPPTPGPAAPGIPGGRGSAGSPPAKKPPAAHH